MIRLTGCKMAISRTRQSEVLAQRPTFVLSPEDPAALQLRDHLADEVLETGRQIRDMTLNPSEPSRTSHSSISSAIVRGVPTNARPEKPPRRCASWRTFKLLSLRETHDAIATGLTRVARRDLRLRAT
jgi:hypothetical protein